MAGAADAGRRSGRSRRRREGAAPGPSALRRRSQHGRRGDIGRSGGGEARGNRGRDPRRPRRLGAGGDAGAAAGAFVAGRAYRAGSRIVRPRPRDRTLRQSANAARACPGPARAQEDAGGRARGARRPDGPRVRFDAPDRRASARALWRERPTGAGGSDEGGGVPAGRRGADRRLSRRLPHAAARPAGRKGSRRRAGVDRGSGGGAALRRGGCGAALLLLRRRAA